MRMLGKTGVIDTFCRYGCCSKYGLYRRGRKDMKRAQRAKEKAKLLRVPVAEW